jgi:hypothetical protein
MDGMPTPSYPSKAAVAISDYHHRKRLRTPEVEAVWLAPGKVAVSLRWFDSSLPGDQYSEPLTYEGDLAGAEDWLARRGVCLGLDGIH